MAIDNHADDTNMSGQMQNSSNPARPVTMTATVHLCMHDFAIDCAACPQYDECPYPDRSSSLMSIVLPAGVTLLSIVALLTFILVIR